RQAGWIVVGVALFAVTLWFLRFDYRVLENYRYIFGIGAVGLLLLPALPIIGQEINGARLWVRFGPIQFQPGELAKILLILFLAGYLREKREVLGQGRLTDLGPLLVIWGASILVLIETDDLGSALLFFGIFLAMLYVATARMAYVAAGAALFAAGAAAAYTVIPRVQERVSILLDPPPPLHPTPHQPVQSLYAIANAALPRTASRTGTPD